MKTIPRLPLLYALFSAFTVSPFLVGQTSPSAPAAPDATADQIVHLEAFTVNTGRDRGYIAVDSLAGGRTNTEIKFTPSAMSSLTRTFLDDVHIDNIRDALKWSPNVVPSDLYAGKQLGNPFNSWDFNFRGAGQSLQGGAGPTRNYFTFYQAADTYNVERLEFDRGPNSILFGVGSVGGVLSIYTKIPRLDRDFITPEVTVDSNGSYRFTVDVNRRISDKAAVRLNLVDDHRYGWRQNDKNHLQAADLAVLFKATETTTFRIEGEVSRARNTLISSTYVEKISKWDSTSFSNTWGAAPGGTGTRKSQEAGFGTNPYNVWIPNLTNKGVMNWSGGYITTGIDPDGIPVAPYAGFYPSTFKSLYSWMPASYDGTRIPVMSSREFTYGSGISKPEYKDITAYIDQKFGQNFDAEVSFYHYTDRHNAKDYEPGSGASIDLNQQLPDGSRNPNVGKMFTDFFLSQQQQNRKVTEARAQLNYHFDAEPFGIPLKQLVSVSAGHQNIKWSARQYNAQLLGTSETDAVKNMVWGRLYFDDPNQSMNLPETINGQRIGYIGMPFDWFDFDETYKLKNYAAVSQTRLWNDKLTILAGARRDDYRHHKVGAHTGTTVDDSASGTTYSAGGIYYFGWLGVFGNYSKNFDPIGPGKNNSLNGKPFGPSTGEGSDYGIRVSTGDGKYYASVSRYDSKSKDRIFSGGKPDFAGIWKNYYKALGQAEDVTKTRIVYDDTEALDVSGYEVDVTANPLSNLRISLNYAKPDSKIVGALPGSRAYLAANLPTWNAATTATADATAASDLRGQLTSAQNTLTQNSVGKTKVGLVDYTASIFANYTFSTEQLKGFSIGGGLAYTGKRYVGDFGAPDGSPKFPYYASIQRATSLVLAYETKFGTYPTRFQINVDNVFDDKKPIITAYHFGWTDATGHNLPSGYFLPAPRTIRFSARVTF